ncbi:MAG: YmdB family metallophosphoesterase [Campylobacterales bacterium]
MRVGFIGDIVGRPGRHQVKALLPLVRREFALDLVVANGENLAHGTGVTMKVVEELRGAGVDILTGGNHTFDKKEVQALIDNPLFLRPFNFPRGVPGRGVWQGEGIRVISLCSPTALANLNNPFEALELLLDEPYDGVTLVDFHAEYTAEKRALYLAYRDRLSAVMGTHTHVGTDDLEIGDGCCYVTDVGLTGCSDNVIGMELEASFRRQRFALPGGMRMPENCKAHLQMIVMEFEGRRCNHALKLKGCESDGWRITQEVRA